MKTSLLKYYQKHIFIIINLLFFSFNIAAQCPVTPPTAIDGCRISAGSVQLGASGSTGYYSWYDANVGGNYLGSGTPFNTPAIGTTTTYYVAAADTNFALDFDGSNDFVALGNPAQLQITGDLTIEMWLKPDNFSARRNPYAKAYGGEGTITQETSGVLTYFYGTSGANTTPYQGFSSNVALNLNQWNHVALVRDLTNMQLYWYINGVLTNTVAANYAAATVSLNNVTIGAGYVSNYDGQIADLRVWNTARTQAEVQSNKGFCLTGAEAGLAAYYQFNDGLGTTLTDLTASANNGTLTNMAPASDWVIANYDYQCPSCESPRTAVVATISGGTPVNLGTDVSLTCATTALSLDAGVGYSNYLWSTGATTQTINITTTGTYWVQVDLAGCLNADTISVTFPSGSLNALSFDGSNDYVALGNPSKLQITGDLTIEMWLKPTNFSGRRNPYAKAYGGEGTITQETSGTLSFYYGISGVDASPYQGFGSNASLNLNEWNHIALVRDLTNMQLYWYINGVLTNQTAATYATANAGSNSATIASGYVSNYAGQIDELRIWNTARTQTEVRNKMCSKVSPSTSGLAAYYSFDDGAGTTLTDKTSAANNGTLTNGPTWQTSGAAIGDASVYLYTSSWAGQTLTHTYCSGENLTISNMSGTPEGVHIYSVGSVPTDVTGIAGLGTNNRYFGVFKVNDAVASYTATYDYTGNTKVGISSEPTVALFKRADNASTPWVNTGAALNTVANTLIATAQSTEFILGSTAVPLPIELLSFDANTNEDKVDLKWLTSSEINNDFFTIERSADAINWEEIITTSGAGNSNQTLAYFETDYEPLTGVSYYRLKQTDFDGKFEYFNIVPVKFVVNKEADGILNIFPSPANAGETVSVEFINIFEEELLVVLRDVQGKEFYSKIHINIEDGKLIGVPIDANIPKGVYLITATSENQIYSQKLIVK